MVWLGPAALPLFALAVLWPSFGAAGASVAAAFIALSAEWAPKAVLAGAASSPAAATTIAALVAPLFAALSMVAASPSTTRLATLARISVLGGIFALSVWGLIAFRWLDAGVISHPIARFAMVIGFVVLCGSPQSEVTAPNNRLLIVTLLGILLGALIGLITGSRPEPVSTIVFDEAHGDWASTALPLEIDDFGRNTTYSWRAIANVMEGAGFKVDRVTQPKSFSAPGPDALYVLKMPIEVIDSGYAQDLLRWVAQGGRLLVVADHTDLFDTTQNLNVLLARIGVRVDSTAVFDRFGQPPIAARSHWSGPSWLSSGRDHRYLTGTSFQSLPWLSLPVHTYGMSFAEQAVYFKANRFGYFRPDSSQPFGNHIAVSMLSHGSGSIQIWLDSTHWSTFAAFQSTYQDAFLQIVERSGRPSAPKIYAMGLVLLCCLAAACLYQRRESAVWVVALAGAIGLTFGASASVRFLEAPASADRRMIEAAIGSSASVELLTPIVESTSRNYARALTALQKWAPVRLHPSAKLAAIGSGSAILLIDLPAEELPPASKLIEWIVSGKRVVLISNPSIWTRPQEQQWLRALGLVLRTERALFEERDASSDLLGRRTPTVTRHAVLRFAAAGSSAWAETESSHLAQTFQLQPSTHRAANPGGALIISSRSDQFSDAAVGDVWEGVPVDDLSRSRERELARLVLSDSVDRSGTPSTQTPSLLNSNRAPKVPDHYIVVSQGKVQAEGRLAGESPGEELSFAETPDAFAWRLRSEAARHLPGCKLDIKTGYCIHTLVDSLLMEWFVVPRFDKAGRVLRLELIHEGRFSGVRDGMNVVFE